MQQSDTPVASFRHAVILLLGSCLPVMATVLIAPVLPQIMQHFSGTPNANALVPLALTVPALVIGICAPLVGIIIDRAGRKKLLMAGMVLYSIFGTAPLYLDSLGAIIASRAAVGLTEAIIMTACTSLIADYFSSPARERYLAQQTMWASVSATLFFGIGGALGESGWRTPFWMYFAAVLLVPVMAAMLWEPESDNPVRRADGAAADRAAFPLRPVLGICAITFGSALAFYTLPVHLGFVMNAIGITSPAMIGLATAAGSIATVIGAVSSRRLAELGVASCLGIAFAALGAGFIIVGTAASLTLVVTGSVIHGFGAGLALPTLLTWLMRQLSFEQRGRGSGAFTASFFSGQFICPLIVLGLGKLLGGLGPALAGLGWVLALAAMLAAGVALFVRPAASLKLPS